MNRPVKVSIGVPVFNGERFLAETLDSILAQTFEDFEIVVSDNASTDDTEDICRRYAEKDERIKYVRARANLGAAHNYNQAFYLSSGEYFKWACHDDLLRPEFLARCVEVLDRDPVIVGVFTGWAPIDDEGEPLEPPPLRYPRWRADSSDPVRRTRFSFRMERRPPSAVYGVYRSEVLRRTGLYRPIHGGDHIFMAEVALYGPIVEVPDVLFLNRWHSSSGGKIPTFRERLNWWLPEPRRGRFGAGHLGSFLLFGKVMGQTAVEQVASIRRSPLTAAQKRRCYAQLPLWFAGEIWRRLERRIPERPGGRR